MYLCRFFCPNTTQDSITWAYEDAVTHEITWLDKQEILFSHLQWETKKTPDKN